MKYSFKNTYSKAKVALEMDKYIIYRTLKSKLSFSGNYLLMKQIPESSDEIDYYIDACRNFFREHGVNFIHLALPENEEINKKCQKYLLKNNFNEIRLELYHLETNNFVKKHYHEYNVEILQKKDYSRFLDFNYNIDLELADRQWAEHNQGVLYDNIRAEEIKQVIAKDGEKIVGIVNVILRDDFFEIDSLYVDKNYRRKGIASQLISYTVEYFNKKNVILVADFNDSPKYMYEKMGFKRQAFQIFYLNSMRK